MVVHQAQQLSASKRTTLLALASCSECTGGRFTAGCSVGDVPKAQQGARVRPLGRRLGGRSPRGHLRQRLLQLLQGGIRQQCRGVRRRPCKATQSDMSIRSLRVLQGDTRQQSC